MYICTGKFSEVGHAMLYVARVAIRIEGYLLFLIQNHKFHLQKDQQPSTSATTASTNNATTTTTTTSTVNNTANLIDASVASSTVPTTTPTPISTSTSNPTSSNPTTSTLNGAYHEAYVRGLQLLDSVGSVAEQEQVLAEISEYRHKIRTLLNDKLFRIIARWIKIAKKEGLTKDACILHAHLAYIHRNIESHELTSVIVFASLSSQIYLFNNYSYDLDLEQQPQWTEDSNGSSGSGSSANKKRSRLDKEEDVNIDLLIPQVELFDMYQRNRSKILQWLLAHSDERNAVSTYLVTHTTVYKYFYVYIYMYILISYHTLYIAYICIYAVYIAYICML